MATSLDIFNIDTDPPTQYTQYDVPQPPFLPPSIVNGDVNIVTTVNGATGPITFSSPDGFAFSGSSGGQVIMTVSNPATARAALGAAASGANADINTFSALTGNTGFNAWTGAADKTSHATYPATVASVGYVQAEMQALMDKMQQITEAFKAVEDALLAWGGLET